MKAYHIYLLRHGMTDANIKRQYAGQFDIPLNSDGIKELQELSLNYKYPYAERFFSSPLKRCTDSLHVLYPEAEIETVPDLAECSFGDYEGKTIDELEGDPNYKKWVEMNGQSAPPNGESGTEFQIRSCKAFVEAVDELLRSGCGSAVIMAHGGTIMSVLGTFGYPRKPFYEWKADFGCGYEIVITPQLWMNSRLIEIVSEIPGKYNDNEESYNE